MISFTINTCTASQMNFSCNENCQFQLHFHSIFIIGNRQKTFSCDSSPRSPNICQLVCVCHTCYNCTKALNFIVRRTSVGLLQDFCRTSVGLLQDFSRVGLLKDFRGLYGHQNLLFYKSQPPGLQELFLILHLLNYDGNIGSKM